MTAPSFLNRSGPIQKRWKDAGPQELEYVKTKTEKIKEKIPEIDELLNSHTTGWKTSRMNKVDLTILRLAVYEMKWDETVPVGRSHRMRQ